jgi:hypothetical protein
MCVQVIPLEIQTPTQSNLIDGQDDCTAACAIAQQYSSATFVSLRFHSRKEKNLVRVKKRLLFHIRTFY